MCFALGTVCWARQEDADRSCLDTHDKIFLKTVPQNPDEPNRQCRGRNTFLHFNNLTFKVKAFYFLNLSFSLKLFSLKIFSES